MLYYTIYTIVFLSAIPAIYSQTCICPAELGSYIPVCGNDGITYRNAETVRCYNTCYRKNLGITSYQACYTHIGSEALQNPAHPYQVYPTPVYPSQVYPTPVYQTQVDCTLQCPSSGQVSPVCGSDGRTYINAALLYCYNRCRNANLSILMTGKCPANLCICTNTKVYKPVCGSDELTYRNPKIVQCLNICKKKNISIQYYKPCTNGQWASI